MPLPRIALLLAALLTGCGTPGDPVAPVAVAARRAAASPPPDHPTVEGVRRRLAQAADGLLYTSESDHPFTWVHHPARAASPLDVATFRAVVGVDDGAPIEVQSLDAFLARHIERADPSDPVAQALVPRYVRLRETLRHAIRDVRVYRVGRIVIDCWIVGTDAHGHVVGLRTRAIET